MLVNVVKLHKSSFKLKGVITSKRPLELLHLDLIGPSRVASFSKAHYVLVIVDDYSRFTWVLFLHSKDEAFENFTIFAKKVQNSKGTTIVAIHSDHGGEFENEHFSKFCDDHGINHNFSFPRAAPQNGVVERKNRTLKSVLAQCCAIVA